MLGSKTVENLFQYTRNTLCMSNCKIELKAKSSPMDREFWPFYRAINLFIYFILIIIYIWLLLSGSINILITLFTHHFDIILYK